MKNLRDQITNKINMAYQMNRMVSNAHVGTRTCGDMLTIEGQQMQISDLVLFCAPKIGLFC